jgi:hypothetical protein
MDGQLEEGAPGPQDSEVVGSIPTPSTVYYAPVAQTLRALPRKGGGSTLREGLGAPQKDKPIGDGTTFEK